MTNRHPLDLRKTPEELEAEGIVHPGEMPMDGTSDEILAWMEAHAKTMRDADQTYRDAVHAYVSSTEG
jgi:hypothetical protein